MKWTGPAELKAEVQKWWERGDLLSELLASESSFPRRLRLKTPTSGEISEHFDKVRSWIAALKGMSQIRLETREINHRVFGKNALPTEVWLDTLDQALSMIGKRRERDRFSRLIDVTRQREPSLLVWLQKRPLYALEHYEVWDRLLQVVDWSRAHPRPDIYLRQVDIAGIDSKFIEAHRAILSEWLDLIHAPESLDSTASGISQFARRFGFRDKPLRVRFRILDPSCALLSCGGDQDMTLDAETFAKLNPKVSTVFITENEINFLAFPPTTQSMVVFGAGYGFDSFSQAEWLLQCSIFYWGDIDTHGFAILNSARAHLPHVQSFLMNEETLLKHMNLIGHEDSPHNADDLQYLTADEKIVYANLKNDTWGKSIRLEQERISWSYVCGAISETLEHSSEMTIHLANEGYLQVSAGDLHTYLQPSECSLRVHLRHHGHEESPPGAYDQLLRRMGEKHRSNHYASFPSVIDLSERTPDERFTATYNAIQNLEPIIYGSLLRARVKLGGVKVEVSVEPDFLILEGSQYVIRDVKIARRVTKQNNPAILSQLQLAGWLYTQIFGRAPARLEVCNGQNEIIQIHSDGGRSSLRHLNQIIRLKLSDDQPYSPVGWSKCDGCSFKNYCWSHAERLRDVAMLAGVDQEMARTLHHAGLGEIETLAQADVSRVSSLQRMSGGRMQRVSGNRATRILKMAESMLTSREIILAMPALPNAENLVMFDIEGLPPHLEESERVYLWGMKVVGTSPSPYIGVVSSSTADGDEQAWNEFLTKAAAIFETYGDTPFIHWHHYERVKIELYSQRYGDPDGIAARVSGNLVDLLDIVQQSVALPVTSYSLKQVETFAGFNRTQTEYGGTWSMAKYIEAIEIRDEESSRECIDQILRYNQEDLDATWTVFQWLRRLVSQSNSMSTLTGKARK